MEKNLKVKRRTNFESHFLLDNVIYSSHNKTNCRKPTISPTYTHNGRIKFITMLVFIRKSVV